MNEKYQIAGLKSILESVNRKFGQLIDKCQSNRLLTGEEIEDLNELYETAKENYYE